MTCIAAVSGGGGHFCPDDNAHCMARIVNKTRWMTRAIIACYSADGIVGWGNWGGAARCGIVHAQGLRTWVNQCVRHGHSFRYDSP